MERATETLLGSGAHGRGSALARWLDRNGERMFSLKQVEALYWIARLGTFERAAEHHPVSHLETHSRARTRCRHAVVRPEPAERPPDRAGRAAARARAGNAGVAATRASSERRKRDTGTSASARHNRTDCPDVASAPHRESAREISKGHDRDRGRYEPRSLIGSRKTGSTSSSFQKRFLMHTSPRSS